jgi:2-dehydro-3-deoxyglucarate aldolase
MNRIELIKEIRNKLRKGGFSIGSWIQIPHSSIAEIMGQSNFDWVALDLEHGAISVHQLPDLFRAIELGGTLPLVRLANSSPKGCKQALDSGSGGVIVPMIESSSQLKKVRDACRWPPSGSRGVGFSRANLFGKYFDTYVDEAQAPILIAMIEDIKAVDSLHEILRVEGLDAIMIGPYDLSASMGITGQFNSEAFIEAIKTIRSLCKSENVACGIHVVEPSLIELRKKIADGYQWVAYSADSILLAKGAEIPDL